MGAQHSNRYGSAGEHALTDVGQLVLYAVFLATWISDSFLFRYSVFLAVHVPAYIRFPVGIATLIASALLALSAHKAVFGEPGREPGVISEGAFSFVRHPMYLGSWLLSVGLVIMTFSVSSAAVSIVIFLFYYLVAKYEELLLLEKFGVKYRKYQARVPMFLPLKFGGKRPTRGWVQDRERQRYQAEPGEAMITSISAKKSRSSRTPLRLKRR
jgi:protein-S-isoprenylcysteine O-methyltransferase Ste14